jgi:hypothetical protein
MASTRLTIKYEPKTGDIDVEFDFAKPIDAGVYRCRAENIYGFDNTESSLLILDYPNIDERPQTLNPDVFQIIDSPLLNPMLEPKNELKKKGKPPKFIVHLPRNINVPYGDKFNTKCKVEGYPYPKVL